MKINFLFKLLNVVSIIVVLGLFSCSTSKKTTTTEPVQAQPQTLNPTPPNLVIWRASRHLELKKEEVIYFYNTNEIDLNGVVTKYDESKVKDGGLASTDTVFCIYKKVPPFTPGRVEELVKDSRGVLIKMKIRFDVKDETYILLYTLEDYARYVEKMEVKKDPNIVVHPVGDSGSFILSADATIYLKGKTSPALATIKDEDDDRLLVKDTSGTVTITISGEAKGMKGGSSDHNITQPAVEDIKNPEPYTPKK